jgi:hypothetical protein
MSTDCTVSQIKCNVLRIYLFIYWVEDIVALLHVSHLDFHLQETGGIDFSQLPNPMQGVIPCPLDIFCIF